jgi:hypothetical protein
MIPNERYDGTDKTKPEYQCPSCKFTKKKGVWIESKYPTGLWSDDCDKIDKEREEKTNPVNPQVQSTRYQSIDLAIKFMDLKRQYLNQSDEKVLTIEEVIEYADKFEIELKKEIPQSQNNKPQDSQPADVQRTGDKINDGQIKDFLAEFKRLDKETDNKFKFSYNAVERIRIINKIVDLHNLSQDLKNKDFTALTTEQAQDLLFWLNLTPGSEC